MGQMFHIESCPIESHEIEALADFKRKATRLPKHRENIVPVQMRSEKLMTRFRVEKRAICMSDSESACSDVFDLTPCVLQWMRIQCTKHNICNL